MLSNQQISSINDHTSLEEQFEQYFIQDVDVRKETILDFIEPNEMFPEQIQDHLALGEKGIIVSTGSERSFFDLLFAEESKCEGLVVIDTETKIKAYVDFNTLLIRLSKNRNEYEQLTSNLKNFGEHKFQAYNRRISVIKIYIEQSDLTEKIKSYYLKHLEDFGSIYLNSPKNWRDVGSPAFSYYNQDGFANCRYNLNDDQFLKLQRYAKSGNIISVTGDINDLVFLKDRNISVVDTSNILDYCLINIQGGIDLHPRVIWTQSFHLGSMYNSYIQDLLNDQEKLEFNSVLSRIRVKYPSKPNSEKNLRTLLKGKNPDSFNADAGPIYSRTTLQYLKKIIEKEGL